MKTLIFSSGLICSFILGFGQEALTGKVMSCKENKPLAFANIVLMKNLSGTTSDENGEFQLTIHESNDSIVISYVGYKTEKIPAAIFVEKRSVCLNESSMVLDEVVVSTKQLDHAKLFEKFRLIRGDLYAQESETSVSEYNLFLKEIDGTSSFAKYNYDLTSYTGAVKEFYQRYHSNTPEPKHGCRKNPEKEEGNYAHYPVINVTHEAAIAYCEWLTDEYNNQKKRKFKKVKFRLPTISEWQIAALGYYNFQSWNLNENTVEVFVPSDSTAMVGPGKRVTLNVSDIFYPWYKAYYYRKKPQNSKNCFLGNFKVPENYTPCLVKKVAGDGFSMMGHVADYFPNNVGLYDVAGNVAEMINENGKACGGSWHHLPSDCTIRSVATYDKPNSWLGFRVFMEVLEK